MFVVPVRNFMKKSKNMCNHIINMRNISVDQILVWLTHPETNIAPENRPGPTRTFHLPTREELLVLLVGCFNPSKNY